MYKKENRLNRKKDFDNIFKNGKTSYSKILGIKTLENCLNIVRFGILVNTKVSKKAVERNKVKRRIREIFKKNIDNIIEGYDIVVITLPAITEKEIEEIKKDIVFKLKKLGIYK